MLSTRWRVPRIGGVMLAGVLVLGSAHGRQARDAPVPPPKVPAPAAGKPSLTVYLATGFNDKAWQQGAFAKVAKVWVAAAPPAVGKKAVVISEILRDGSVLDARVSTPSGSEGWDKAALEAVRKASPFAALPATWPGTSLEVHWHFEYAK